MSVKRYNISNKDLLDTATGNVYNTEYSTKITIPIKNSILSLFKELKRELNDKYGIPTNNAKLLEIMIIEYYNMNKEHLKI